MANPVVRDNVMRVNRMMAAEVILCQRCGTELREGAHFCDACGSVVVRQPDAAEYKQVTVLFLDLVQSMRLAQRLGTERVFGA